MKLIAAVVLVLGSTLLLAGCDKVKKSDREDMIKTCRDGSASWSRKQCTCVIDYVINKLEKDDLEEFVDATTGGAERMNRMRDKMSSGLKRRIDRVMDASQDKCDVEIDKGMASPAPATTYAPVPYPTETTYPAPAEPAQAPTDPAMAPAPAPDPYYATPPAAAPAPYPYTTPAPH